MLMIEHIARLQADSVLKSNILRGLDLENSWIDLRFLALAMIDFVMEESAFGPGAEQAALIEAGTAEAMRMKPDLPEAKARTIAQRLFGHLINSAHDNKALSVNYYDPSRADWSFLNFTYLELVRDTVDHDRLVIRMGEASRKMSLGMLDLSDEIYADLEAAMIRKALERGRLEDAEMLANKARVNSINYRTFLQEQLYAAQMNAALVDWRKDVLPRINQARDHLRNCLENDYNLLVQINERIGDLRKDPVAFRCAVRIRDTIASCEEIHSHLHRELDTINERFLEAAMQGLASRHNTLAIDPFDDLLAPLMGLSLQMLSDAGDGRGADHIFSLLTLPRQPRLGDFYLTLESLFRDLPAPAAAAEPELEKEEIIRPNPATHTPEQIDRVTVWLVERIEAHGTITLDEILRAALDEGWDWLDMRALVLAAICATDHPCIYAAREEGGYHALNSGRRLAGDNIRFTWDLNKATEETNR